ncbi:hypothetical protein SGL43_03215 [Streptomyces globisporus]|uniref:Uncharacterized protein n=1 Tax=Streptomyces globisporus TaxID=1908 RepID=A0ABN8V0X6_STRGL|nr:hypothetical protein SGL43_03215 [Streptomyces globisporus]
MLDGRAGQQPRTSSSERHAVPGGERDISPSGNGRVDSGLLVKLSRPQ